MSERTPEQRKYSEDKEYLEFKKLKEEQERNEYLEFLEYKKNKKAEEDSDEYDDDYDGDYEDQDEGVKRPSKFKKTCTIVFQVLAVLYVLGKVFKDDEPSAPVEPVSQEQVAAEPVHQEPVVEKVPCRQDINCYGQKYSAQASERCRFQIEMRASGEVQWLSTNIFTEYRWEDMENGVISYSGQYLKVQNSAGAFIDHHYSCSYDTRTDTASNIGMMRLSGFNALR